MAVVVDGPTITLELFKMVLLVHLAAVLLVVTLVDIGKVEKMLTVKDITAVKELVTLLVTTAEMAVVHVKQVLMAQTTLVWSHVFQVLKVNQLMEFAPLV